MCSDREDINYDLLYFSNNCTSRYESNKGRVVIATMPLNSKAHKTDERIKRAYNKRDNISNKNYNEGDNDNEDFSPESSECILSPNREIKSDTPSTTSSIEGDTTFIDRFINLSDMRSPSTISNISLVLDNVDFVASPTVIYKIMNDRISTNKAIPQHHEDINSNALTVHNLALDPKQLEKQSKNSSSISNQADDVVENETLTPDEINLNFKPNETAVGYNDILAGVENINSCTDGLDGTTNSSNDLIYEDNLNNQVETQEIVLERLNDTEIIQSPQLSSSIMYNDNIKTEAESNMIEQSKISTLEKQVKLSRKRKFNKNEWNDYKNKTLKNSGEAYKGCRSKKSYPAKTIGPVCSCKQKCSDKFTSQQRESLFNTFYKLQSHELQWQYIAKRIISNHVKRITLERKNNRTQTLKYSFPLNGYDIPVCKVYFLNTLRISEQTVYTALEKIKKDKSLTDERGTHSNRPHKMSIMTKETIMKHINLFPAIESHHVRKDLRQHLSEQLNISKMYRLYKSWFAHQDYSREYLATKRQYESIFNTEYNYSFFRTEKDLCAICSLYEQAENTKKASLEENYRAHLKRKNRVVEMETKEKAAVDSTHTTIAFFDQAKVLSVPQSDVDIFHYKRKYPIYNFTVFDTVKKTGYCYVWHLSVAKRGSTEIGSCLLQFIQHEAERGIKHISFYSDGCAEKNKNRLFFAMYLYALKTYELESITHSFFESGHSQSEGENMHSCVEKAMKNKVLFTPDQVYSVILNAKVSGEKYNLKEMEQSDFYDLKSLISGRNWLKDVQGRNISWSKIMEVKVLHVRPHILQIKYDFEDEYFELDTNQDFAEPKRGRVSKNLVEQISTMKTLKNIYHQPITISKPLHDDLLGLCASEAIPKHYHGFYESLVSCVNPERQNPDKSDGSDIDDAEM